VHRGSQGSRHLPDRVGLAAGHVEHAGHRVGRLQREQVGAGNIPDMDEVAPLAAVLQHLRRLPGRQGAAEDGRHTGIGGVAGHPRTVDVVVAQGRDRRPARGHGRERQVFLVELGGGVDAAWVGFGLLGHRQRLEVAPAGWAWRLPAAGGQPCLVSGCGAHPAVGLAAVATLAVDDHRAGQQQPVDPAGAAVQRGQQPGGAQGVVAHVVHDVGQVLAQPDHGRLVADRLDAIDGTVQRGPVQVGPEVVDVVAQVVGWAAVGLGVEPVQHPDPVPALGEQVDEMAADEAGTAGDEHLHGAACCGLVRRRSTPGRLHAAYDPVTVSVHDRDDAARPGAPR
jgi:hypothetical protein